MAPLLMSFCLVGTDEFYDAPQILVMDAMVNLTFLQATY